MNEQETCLKCNWVKDQSGSSHHLCPKMCDFSFGLKMPDDWMKVAVECGLFVPRGDDYNPKCNAFMIWTGHGKPWPDESEMKILHSEWLLSLGGENKNGIGT